MTSFLHVILSLSQDPERKNDIPFGMPDQVRHDILFVP